MLWLGVSQGSAPRPLLIRNASVYNLLSVCCKNASVIGCANQNCWQDKWGKWIRGLKGRKRQVTHIIWVTVCQEDFGLEKADIAHQLSYDTMMEEVVKFVREGDVVGLKKFVENFEKNSNSVPEQIKKDNEALRDEYQQLLQEQREDILHKLTGVLEADLLFALRRLAFFQRFVNYFHSNAPTRMCSSSFGWPVRRPCIPPRATRTCTKTWRNQHTSWGRCSSLESWAAILCKSL